MATRAQPRLDHGEPMPTKLDALGALSSGGVALVEIKDADGSIDRALAQAATHFLWYPRLADRA